MNQPTNQSSTYTLGLQTTTQAGSGPGSAGSGTLGSAPGGVAELKKLGLAPQNSWGFMGIFSQQNPNTQQDFCWSLGVCCFFGVQVKHDIFLRYSPKRFFCFGGGEINPRKLILFS